MYLSVFGIDSPTAVQTVCQATGGHPMAVALMAESFGQATPQMPSAGGVHLISAKLLRESAPAVLQEAVDILALVGSVDYELLNAVLARPIDAPLFHRLADLSFVHRTTQGLALHDVARAHLLADLRTREPDRYARLRLTTARVLLERVARANGSDLRHPATQLLTVCLDGLSMKTPYCDLTVEPSTFHIDAYGPGDWPQVQRMTRQWLSYSANPYGDSVYIDFLRNLAVQIPQSFRLVRDVDGRAIAMFVYVLVHEQTTPLLTHYFPNEMAECFTPQMLTCSVEDADHYYAVLVAFDTSNRRYGGPELVGALARDCLWLLGLGTKVSLIVTNPDLKQLLCRLGFQLRPTRSRVMDAEGLTAELVSLDLRGGRFGAWIAELLNQETEGALPPLTDVLTHNITDAVVRDALHKLALPETLGHSALASVLGLSGPRLRTLLLDAMTGAGDESDLQIGARQREWLKTVFLTHNGDMLAAAKALYVSRATLYRRIAEAVEALRAALCTGFLATSGQQDDTHFQEKGEHGED